MARLRTTYKEKVIPALMNEFKYKSVMEVPKVEKVVINMGVGEAVQNIKVLDAAAAELAAISGQKPMITKAKKSIATFKLREGMPIGCMVTLRRDKMYEFIDRFVNVTLPRVRDFKGISGKTFDGNGNFAMGLKEQIIFPEIEYDKVDKIRGMNIVFVTSAKTDKEGKALLKELGLPFRD